MSKTKKGRRKGEAGSRTRKKEEEEEDEERRSRSRRMASCILSLPIAQLLCFPILGPKVQHGLFKKGPSADSPRRHWKSTSRKYTHRQNVCLVLITLSPPCSQRKTLNVGLPREDEETVPQQAPTLERSRRASVVQKCITLGTMETPCPSTQTGRATLLGAQAAPHWMGWPSPCLPWYVLRKEGQRNGIREHSAGRFCTALRRAVRKRLLLFPPPPPSEDCGGRSHCLNSPSPLKGWLSVTLNPLTTLTRLTAPSDSSQVREINVLLLAGCTIKCPFSGCPFPKEHCGLHWLGRPISEV